MDEWIESSLGGEPCDSKHLLAWINAFILTKIDNFTLWCWRWMSGCKLCTLWDILFWESDIVMFAEYDLHIWEVISRVSSGGGSASALKTPSHCKLMSQLNPWMDMEGMSMSGTELYSQHLTQETWMFTQMMRQGTFHQYLPHQLPHHCAPHTRTCHQEIYLYIIHIILICLVLKYLIPLS